MSSLFHLITRENEEFNMGAEEWKAIRKIEKHLSYMEGRMSILWPILIVTVGSFLTSIGSLIVMLLIMKNGG